MREFRIRAAVPDDARGINDHLRRMADEPDNMISYARGEFQRNVDEERQLLERVLASDNSHMLVATADQEIVGMCRCFGGDRVKRHTTGLGITVRREWRDQGVGRALMEAMIEWARDNPLVHRIEFTVFTHNARAVHLYRKLGFEEEGILREAYFKDGRFVDGFMMAMIFNDEQ